MTTLADTVALQYRALAQSDVAHATNEQSRGLPWLEIFRSLPNFLNASSPMNATGPLNLRQQAKALHQAHSGSVDGDPTPIEWYIAWRQSDQSVPLHISVVQGNWTVVSQNAATNPVVRVLQRDNVFVTEEWDDVQGQWTYKKHWHESTEYVLDEDGKISSIAADTPTVPGPSEAVSGHTYEKVDSDSAGSIPPAQAALRMAVDQGKGLHELKGDVINGSVVYQQLRSSGDTDVMGTVLYFPSESGPNSYLFLVPHHKSMLVHYDGEVERFIYDDGTGAKVLPKGTPLPIEVVDKLTETQIAGIMHKIKSEVTHETDSTFGAMADSVDADSFDADSAGAVDWSLGDVNLVLPAAAGLLAGAGGYIMWKQPEHLWSRIRGLPRHR